MIILKNIKVVRKINEPKHKKNNMQKTSLLFVAAIYFATIVHGQIQYPFTKKVNQVDTVFGHIIPDPYRWMEDFKSEEMTDWFKAQNKFSDAALANLNGVDSFVNELNTYNTQKTWWRRPVFKFGDRLYYSTYHRGQVNANLYYKKENDTTEYFIYDSWKINPGKKYGIPVSKLSPDGNYLLTGFDVNGEEYPFLKIYNTQTGQWLPDSIPHSYTLSPDWAADSKGFIYAFSESNDRTDSKNLNKDVFKLHKINTSYEQDKTILNEKLADKVEPRLASNYANLFIKNSKTRIYLQPNQANEYAATYFENNNYLSDTSSIWKPLYTLSDSILSFLEDGTNYYFICNKGNGFKSLKKTSFANPDFANATTLLKQDTLWQLERIEMTKSYILAIYSNYGFLDKVVIINKHTNAIMPVKSLEKFDRFWIGGLGTETDDCFVYLWSVSKPSNGFPLDIKKDKLISEDFWKPKNQTILDGWENIISEVIQVPSNDGTLIPMSIMRDKNCKLDGNNICFLYGYGAYGIGVKNNHYNAYNPAYSLLLKRGVILAHAYVRGGGEKGEAWHKAGLKGTKANSWKDFIACAEYLIKNKYTQPAKLACVGYSAGGVLIGRAITERPDLFAAAFIGSGDLSLMRSAQYANGIGNYNEFGDPNIKQEFEWVLNEDATFHVHPNIKYPATFITTGINDARVIPWVPAKFAATLQANSSSQSPVLFHIDFEGGHFGNPNANTMIEKLKNDYRAEFFMLWQCGHKDFQKK